MVRMRSVLGEGLRVTSTHGPSETRLVTDAPVDNHGRGESFSPTDLLATALLTCMLTVMEIAAHKRKRSLAGAHGTVEKRMSASGPRRVAHLVVELIVPAAVAETIGEDARRALEEVGETCPVRLSLGEGVAVETRYVWESR